MLKHAAAMGVSRQRKERKMVGRLSLRSLVLRGSARESNFVAAVACEESLIAIRASVRI